MPTTRSGKSSVPNGASVTRSGRQYGVEAVAKPKPTKPVAVKTFVDKNLRMIQFNVACEIVGNAALEHKFVPKTGGLTSDEVIMAMTDADLKPNAKPNYLLGTHHFIFTLKENDARSFGFDKLEIVFKMYHGYMGPKNSTAVSDIIVHREQAGWRSFGSGLVITDPEPSFWRNSTSNFEFALYESMTFADEIVRKLITHNTLKQIILRAVVVAQMDMERVVEHVIRRKVEVFKLEGVIERMFQH